MQKPSLRQLPLQPPWHTQFASYCKEGHPAQVRSNPPGDLTSLKVGREGKELLERQSLEIFTIMANDGRPFAECLSAILLSGIQWGVSGMKDRTLP